MTDSIDGFIKQYNSEKDRDKILFDGYKNEKGSFYDVNDHFRTKVSVRLKELSYCAPSELLRDLFVGHCEFSKHGWSCYKFLGEIGQALIENSKTKFLMDYLHYSRYYFDCQLASGQVNWTEDLVIEIREYLLQIKQDTKSKVVLNDIEFGLNNRFGEHWIKSRKQRKTLSKRKNRK